MRLAWIGVLLATACVRYTKEPLEWETLERTVAERHPGEVDYAAALAFAREHNPELKRLRAEAQAAGFDVPPTSVVLTVNTLESKVPGFVDPVALLKLGPRGARAKAAGERERALLEAMRARDLEVAAGIAEAYLIERVLRSIAYPEVSADPARFRLAGLASDADAARVDYARAKERAERIAVEELRRENLARLRRLLGASASARVEVVVPDGSEFPPLPERGNLLARPDLAAALGRYHVADAEFRAAVLDQYPVIGVGPAFNWDLVRWGLFLPARIPVGAAGPARAAAKRREAARLAVEEALLRAQEDASASRARFARTAALEHAARAGADAAEKDLRYALAHLEVSPDAFVHVARAAPDAIERMSRVRTAAIESARARVALARAYAWPHTEEQR